MLIVSLASNLEIREPVLKSRLWEVEHIDFTGEDLKGIVQPHEDALVMTLWIRGFDVKRVMID